MYYYFAKGPGIIYFINLTTFRPCIEIGGVSESVISDAKTKVGNR